MNITSEAKNNSLAVRISLIIGLTVVCSQRVIESLLSLIYYPGSYRLIEVILYTIGIAIIIVMLIIIINTHKKVKIIKQIIAIICLILSDAIMILLAFTFYSVEINYLCFISFGVFQTLFFLFTSMYLNQIKMKTSWKTPLFISTILLIAIIISQLINYIVISVYSIEIVYPAIALYSTVNISIIFSLTSIVAFIGLYLEIMKNYREKREVLINEEQKEKLDKG